MRNRKTAPIARGVGAVSILFLAWAVYTPIPFALIKITALGCLACLLIGLSMSGRYGKTVSILSALLLMAFVLWPQGTVEPRSLRRHYIEALLSYQGTPYVWGGENGRGLDCSGLVRRAMIDALLSTGWESKNPALWREAALVWWYDCSANEMKRGYSGRIQTLFAAKSLNALAAQDSQQLQPGDLAVLESGVHVLAFVDGTTWVQANPNLVNGGDKVIQTTAPTRNAWFSQPVVICRWKSLF